MKHCRKRLLRMVRVVQPQPPKYRCTLKWKDQQRLFVNTSKKRYYTFGCYSNILTCSNIKKVCVLFPPFQEMMKRLWKHTPLYLLDKLLNTPGIEFQWLCCVLLWKWKYIRKLSLLYTKTLRTENNKVFDEA